MSAVEEPPDLPEPVDLEAIESDLRAVDQALVKLENEEYGRCVRCGATIGAEVLAEDPLVTSCRSHSPTPSPEPNAQIAAASPPDALPDRASDSDS